MLFNSIQFMIFLPIVVFIYYIIPNKIRYIWLLIASYFFYMCWNPKYIILIMASTIVTYLSGIAIQYFKERDSDGRRAKYVLMACLFFNIGILVLFKYLNWILQNVSSIFHIQTGIIIHWILPVGISFYTFQALGYTIDVYRGSIKAEKNILKYALFVSFFPQLVAGPIERSKNLLSQIDKMDKIKFKANNLRDGGCLLLYGFFLKIVIADRAAILVDQVFDNYIRYGFVELMAAAILFGVQILCDFNGYTIIAQGSAKILGIRLMDNFHQPYLATSIKEFWRRWHISLTSWFTDYLYIPLGGNRKGTVRKMLNIMIVFMVSGLWHGASWNYVAWGILHGLYQNIEIMVQKIRYKFYLQQKDRAYFSTRLVMGIWTFLLIDIAWIFFRANSFGDAISYFEHMFSCFQKVSLLSLGFQWYDWLIFIIAVLIMLVIDVLHEKNICIREWIYSEKRWFRWLIYLGTIWVLILFGKYGVEYDASQFIYFQF